MLHRGFEELNLPEIAAIVDIRNTASERVIQKIGMKQRGGADCHGITIRYYTIIGDEFNSRSSAR
jgi:RimJ/RimL family protein N-acetyltransferase